MRAAHTLCADACMFDIVTDIASTQVREKERDKASANIETPGFRATLDKVSNTKRRISDHFVSNYLHTLLGEDSRVPPSTSSIRDLKNMSYYRFHFKLPSTLREQAVFPVFARELFRELSRSYIDQFLHWLLTVASSRCRNVSTAVACCVEHTMSGYAAGNEKEHVNLGIFV